MEMVEIKDFLTWFDAELEGYKLQPVVKAQTEDSCTHYSLCPTIEVRNQILWIREDKKRMDSDKDYKVDVEWMIKVSPPPRHPYILMKPILQNYDGYIKARSPPAGSSPWPFKIDDCDSFSAQEVSRVIKHLSDGPVVGSFVVCENYDELDSIFGIYKNNGKPRKIVPGIFFRHSVCIVGVARMADDEDGVPTLYAYLNANYINHLRNGRGMMYMTIESMEKVRVPLIESLDVRAKRIKKS